jgi:hypothetical protein
MQRHKPEAVAVPAAGNPDTPLSYPRYGGCELEQVPFVYVCCVCGEHWQHHGVATAHSSDLVVM